MSVITPIIEKINGAAVTTGTQIIVNRSFEIEGIGFPNGELAVRLGAASSTPIKIIKISATGTFSDNIMATVAGTVTLTLTETDATPKQTSINLDIQKKIIENLVNEELRFALNQEFVSNNNFKFIHDGNIERSFSKSIEAISKTNLVQYAITDAQRETNFGPNVYVARSEKSVAASVRISLRGTDDTPIKLNRMSFSYIAVGPLSFEWSDGKNFTPIKLATQGLDKFTFSTLNMQSIIVKSTPAASFYFVAGNFEAEPV